MTRDVDTASALIYVPSLSRSIPGVNWIGGKARSLARLRELTAEGGFEVPRFFALTTGAYEMAAGRPIPGALRRSVEDAGREVGLEGKRVAVRSSAVVEDSDSRSYAGLFESVLDVPFETEALWNAVSVVWASATAPRTALYGESDRARGRMAVVIQEMVEPEASGVAFSVDPVGDRKDVAVVSAVLGLGQGLVSGELDADSYWVGKDGQVTSRVVRKDRALVGASAWEEISAERASKPALSDDEARLIASRARLLEARFGAPQDIEWALVPGGASRRLVVLQSRPITRRAAPSGPKHVWDNSNIVESYAGITSPLTYSFARGVYEEVYRQFCRLLGVPERTLEEYRPVFASMLGHIRGRVYYDLLNWYRMLALLPGYRLNREFMERMMGVREKLQRVPEPPASGSKVTDAARLATTTIRVIAADLSLGREVPAFVERVERAIAPVEGRDTASWSAEEALAQYRRLEAELLRNWRTPIVNDFSAMVFFGVLGRLTERWLPDLPASVVNDLLCGETGIRSTVPARRVMQLARRVGDDAVLRRAFLEESDARALWRRLESGHAEFLAHVREYLDEFGDRCVEELKLETIPPSAEPAALLPVIGGYVKAGLFDSTAGREREVAVRVAAERLVHQRLGGWRRPAYRMVLARARRRVRDRENLRFERTRVFGAVRRIFVTLGARMAERGALAEPRDVFYLTVEEVFAYFRGEGAAEEMRGLAGRRREEFAAYAREPAPPSRFESDGAAAPPPVVAARAASVGALEGVGCCPGVVRAPVRLVRDPGSPGELSGRILVAERTDPGWTLLFPLASGLLVERGSLLSHSAIVAREIGLPCVVGIPDLMCSLEDGEEVEMDGAAGTVRRLARAI